MLSQLALPARIRESFQTRACAAGFTWVEARDAFAEISFVWGIWALTIMEAHLASPGSAFDVSIAALGHPPSAEATAKCDEILETCYDGIGKQ